MCFRVTLKLDWHPSAEQRAYGNGEGRKNKLAKQKSGALKTTKADLEAHLKATH